jgi:anti-sigma regulatory factor (Ser/Thr protein kinase)
MTSRGAGTANLAVAMTQDVPAPSASVESFVVLPCEAASVAAGRRFVSAFLADLQLEWLRDEAVLLTSELLTNCVLHGHGRPRLAVRWCPPDIEVAVTDDGTWARRRMGVDLGATSGRGLQIVDRLALASGARESSAGTTLWFTLRMLPVSLPAPRNGVESDDGRR